jgi:hypothetical protein
MVRTDNEFPFSCCLICLSAEYLVEQSNVFNCLKNVARIENVIDILVACLGLQCPVNRVPLLVVIQYSKRCRVTFDPLLLEFENKISYLGGNGVLPRV